MLPIALTIAGSDPSGGAGIQADLKTFHQFGVYGTSVITLLTVQNTQRVSRVEVTPAPLVIEQLDAVLEDMTPGAAKTGALGSAEVIRAVAERARRFAFPLVVDPVLISKHGAPLLAGSAVSTLTGELLPCAFLVTPNYLEALALTGQSLSPDSNSAARTHSGWLESLAKAIAAMGPKAVLIKGGHWPSETAAPESGTVPRDASAKSSAPESVAEDLLYYENGFYRFASPRIATRHTHGTGCTYSAAITALLARGVALPEAVRAAKTFIHRAIETNPALGQGHGPVNHFAPVE